jgi:hypothetical protein
MRREVPNGDLATLIKQAVAEKVERLEAKRSSRVKAPRSWLADAQARPASRHIPAAVRRAVSERDEDRCRYTDERGRRCSARSRLEFHHQHPFGMGGDHSPANVMLACAVHNRLLAEHDYGRMKIGRQARTPAILLRSTPGP